MSEDDRIRWHCRRGLLELDLTLQKFLASRFQSLSQAQRAAFTTLLEREDGELWDLVSGRISPAHREEAAIVALLQDDGSA